MTLGLLFHCWPLPVPPADLAPAARRFIVSRAAQLRAAPLSQDPGHG